MNKNFFIKKSTRRLLLTLTASFLVLSFLGLFLNSGLVQAAPSGQETGWRFVLPVFNTNNQTSIFTVTNLAAQTISVRHEFYAGGFPGGQFVAVLTDTHFSLESKIYALNRIPNFPSNFVGDVVIISNQPITGSTTAKAIAIPTPAPSTTTPERTATLLPPLPQLRPERVEINWTLVTFIIIGIFAISGFFKGWWKEAITTFFLGILIFFLAMPDVAGWFINLINQAIAFVWNLLANLGIVIPVDMVRLDAGSGETWLIILLLFMGLAIFISRASLSSLSYLVTPIGNVLGAVLGGVNGFLIINLVKHYVEGKNLPGNNTLSTEIATAGAAVSPGANIQITGLPGFTLFSFLLPWLIIAFGVLIIFLVRKGQKKPWGYIKL